MDHLEEEKGLRFKYRGLCHQNMTPKNLFLKQIKSILPEKSGGPTIVNGGKIKQGNRNAGEKKTIIRFIEGELDLLFKLTLKVTLKRACTKPEPYP